MPKRFSLHTVWLLVLGVYSGLPLVAIGSTLKARLTEEGFSLTVIGLFSSITLPYAIKFLWSPLFDRFSIPGLGRRKGWLVLCGALSGVSLCGLGLSTQGWTLCLLAFCCATCSASFDIVVDAYRRELLAANELGLGTALFVNGYRVGMLISGAGALALADHIIWQDVYLLLGAVMASSSLVCLLMPTTPEVFREPHSLADAYLHPLKDFFSREGWLLIVVFILLFKLGDSLAGELTMPMYLNIGYTKTEIALVVKGYGLGAALVGALVGGILLLRMNLWHALFTFGILQALSTLCFVALPFWGHPSNELLGAVIGFENITAGMGTAGFTALLAQLTNRAFSASQYALLSSLIGIPRAILAAPCGFLAEQIGYIWFFWLCTVIALPGIFLIPKLKKRVLLIQ